MTYYLVALFLFYIVFIERPKLTLETQPRSTGNEGVDHEREWRNKSGLCEHRDRSRHVSHGGDPPLECDIADDDAERKSSYEENANPDKHYATEKPGDSTWICDNCHMIICDGCTQDYSDSSPDTTTASQAEFPVIEKIDSTSQNTGEVDSKEESNPQNTEEVFSREDSDMQNTEEVDSKEESNPQKSVEQDFYEPYSEMPSFLNMDD